VVIALGCPLTAPLFAQSEWPMLTRSAWRNMTVEQISSHLESKSVSARGEDGVTALMMASAANSNPEVVQALIDGGADVSTRDDAGRTPLMFAAWRNGNPEMARTLVEAGAQVSAETEAGETPLILAAARTSAPEVVQALLAAGAGPAAVKRGWRRHEARGGCWQEARAAADPASAQA
jgi:ankyrin repeat protein